MSVNNIRQSDSSILSNDKNDNEDSEHSTTNIEINGRSTSNVTSDSDYCSTKSNCSTTSSNGGDYPTIIDNKLSSLPSSMIPGITDNNKNNNNNYLVVNPNTNNSNNKFSITNNSQTSSMSDGLKPPQMNHIIQMTTGNGIVPPPKYEPLVQDCDDDIDGVGDDLHQQQHHNHHSRKNIRYPNGSVNIGNSDKLTNISASTTANIEPINCHGMVEIVRSKPKKSMRISFMVLFKSCFGRGPMMMRILSALFFAISSFLLVVINKIVLTTFHFPSVLVLGTGQVLATIVILNICRRLNIVKFPYYSREVNAKMFPLPFFYLGNLVAGLGSTKRLNLPMLTVLRRFTILMTMIGEFYLLGINQSLTIKMTVFMMIGGAVIAASNDLAFDAAGYVYVLLNDVFSTFNGIYMKKKLDSRDLGKYGILYYNALFIVVPMFIISMCVDDWRQCFLEFEHWNSPMFVLSFMMSCVMGFVLMYSTALCTQHNSALTTTIVGCLKNILVTFIGMYIGGDYIFSTVNFVGLNISMIGSLIYSYVIFVHKSSKPSSSSSTSSVTGSAPLPPVKT